MAFPKQKDIEIPLLKALIAAGGRATPKEAVERVTEDSPDLTPADLTMKQPWKRNKKVAVFVLCSLIRGTMEGAMHHGL